MSTTDRAPVLPGEAYCYLWSYRVRREAEAAFVAHYRPDGDWARLFARAPGYRRTDLLRDRTEPLRYLTCDFWDSADAHHAFRRQFSAEYAVLDVRCGDFTVEETALGEYAVIDAGVVS